LPVIEGIISAYPAPGHPALDLLPERHAERKTARGRNKALTSFCEVAINGDCLGHAMQQELRNPSHRLEALR